MSEKSIAEIYRDFLFIMTGWIPYYAVGHVIDLLLRYFCPDGHGGVSCDWLLVPLFIVCTAGFPLAIAQFHKTGKWFWLVAIPKIVGLP